MASTDLARKAVAQGGRPLQRQATGVPEPTGSRSKGTAASRRLHKMRSMRIPAIENDMMNRIGITKKRKAMARATSPKATRSSTRSSPYKTLLVGIARTKDGSNATSDSEGSGDDSSGSSVNLVRCASPEPESHASSSNTPQPPKQPAAATSAAEAKGKKKSNTPQSTVVLRPLPSRVAASSSRGASPLSRTPLDAPKAPETRRRATRSSVASPPLRPDSYLPRKRSPLARSDDALITEKKPSSPSPLADKSTAQPKKVHGKGAPCVSSSEEGDSQSDDHSISDATSDVGSSVPDTSAADVAQAAAIKQSLLNQIEERNEGKKWDDLLGFFHGLAPGEVGGLLKTATRAGRRALRRFAGKERAEPGPSNRENDAHVLGRAQQPRRRDESVLRFDGAGSNGEGEVMNQSIVPPRQRQFLYKAKGKARARSPSPLLPASPPPVFVGASTSSSHASNDIPAPVAPKRARTPEEDDDDDTSEPPTKRRKARPLVREGAFYEYPKPAQPQNDSDAEQQPVHMNLIGNFLDHVQDLDITGWLPRIGGSAGDPFSAHDEDDDIWTLGAARRRRRADGGAESDELGSMSSSHLPWS